VLLYPNILNFLLYIGSPLCISTDILECCDLGPMGTTLSIFVLVPTSCFYSSSSSWWKFSYLIVIILSSDSPFEPVTFVFVIA
jgi:hypothetical protein